jgi:hypothetical protein
VGTAEARDLDLLAQIGKRSSQTIIPLASHRRVLVSEQRALNRADSSRLGQRTVLEVRTNCQSVALARGGERRVLERCQHYERLHATETLTPGVSTVNTVEPLNSLDIFFAPASGVTGSAVLPMNSSGKLVLPPILAPVDQ